MSGNEQEYNTFVYTSMNCHLTTPRTHMVTTFAYDSPWGKIIYESMIEAELVYAHKLLMKLKNERVTGSIVEFGVFEGFWLKQLANWRESLNLDWDVWGFDSFEGLPATTAADLDCWKEGDYAADYAGVSKNLDVASRPWLHLVKGWFNKTLIQTQVQSIDRIAFARIDCDLYEPAVECLKYLGPRLVDQAILVFDDWTFDLSKGETRAFYEWVPQVPNLKFQFLEANAIGHFYLTVSRA